MAAAKNRSPAAFSAMMRDRLPAIPFTDIKSLP
jgi:hypothetical protein